MPVFILPLILHCSASGSSDGASEPGPPGDFAPRGNSDNADNSGGAGGASSGGSGAPIPVLPPEVELEQFFDVPVATSRFVWSANPKSGRVAQIDPVQYKIQTIEAGNGPTFLAALPPSEDVTLDRALVLNVLSQDASLLVAKGASLTATTFPVAAAANRWAIDSQGKWGVAWSFHDPQTAVNKAEGFQDITVVDLAQSPPVPTIVSTGYRPTSVSFDQLRQRVVVITEDGAVLVDLRATPPSFLGRISLLGNERRVIVGPPAGSQTTGDAGLDAEAGPIDSGSSPDTSSSDASSTDADGGNSEARAPGADTGPLVQTPPESEGSLHNSDISVSPDGQYAVVRTEGNAEVTVVDLLADARTTFSFPGPVSDLDLATTPDGLRAVAVVRDRGDVFVLPIPAVLQSVSSIAKMHIDGLTVGSVVLAGEANTALFYSNQSGEESLASVNLATMEPATLVRLHSPVLSVFATKDSKHAIVLHKRRVENSDVSLSGAFSVVSLTDTRPPRIEETVAPPTAVELGKDSENAIITVRDDTQQIYGAYLVKMSQLTVKNVTLASPPRAAGFVPGGQRAYVSEEHPAGRVTFIDLKTSESRTLTGFELGSRIVDGTRGAP